MSAPALVVETDGVSTEGIRGSHALKIKINGRDINLPITSPYQNEIERAEKRYMTISSPSVTFLEHVTSPEDFIDSLENRKCAYEKFARDNSSLLVNYSFDLAPSQHMSEALRNAIRDVQIDSKSEFLFEYELDINQTVDALMEQLEQAQQWLLEKKSTKILVPVIDMKIEDEDLFLKKLQKLAEKFKRINLVYQSPTQSPAHWGFLQKFLKENIIWCHMDCVLNRYNNEKISHRVSLYALGISSSSIAYGFGGDGTSYPMKIYEFDQNTIKYERLPEPYTPSKAEKKDRTWINSLNEEIEELKIMREHARNGTLYTDYVLTKSGMVIYLSSF